MKAIQTLKTYLKNRKKSDYVFDGIIVLFFILFFFTDFSKTLSVWYHQLTLDAPALGVYEKDVLISDSAYDWKLQSLDGEIIEFSDFKNIPVFLSFWTTWCSACVAELPGIDKLKQEFSGRMVFLLVNSIDEPEKIKSFLRKKNYDFEIYQPLDEIPSDFSAAFLPTNYIISKDGRILFAKSGAVDWEGESVKEWFDTFLN